MSYADEFTARFHRLVSSLSGALSADEVAILERLVDSNEAAEALLSLSEVIVQRRISISRAQLVELQTLANGDVADGALSASLGLQVRDA